ncbi:hypothetical protein BD414DRAFT_516981 [Trametes punicea]|nr:hypothetical protein BD414DRAFT_516981 [Trametes punicea]
MAPSTVSTRGRKRFIFDLDTAIQSAAQGVEFQGLRLSAVSPGEDDDSFDCVITKIDGDLEAVLTFLVSDASEYPFDHVFFCSVQNELPHEVVSAIENTHEDGSMTIQRLMMRTLGCMATGVAMLHQSKLPRCEDNADNEVYTEEGEEDEDDYGVEHYDIDDPELFGVHYRDFNEIAAHGYHPGFIRFGVDDFALSVSLPAKSLADIISPRALIAWDRFLLAGPQHFTLLISGFRGVYPMVEPRGTLSRIATARNAAPQFRVGLTPDYKPKKEDVAEALRRFGLQKEGAAAFETKDEEDIQDTKLSGDSEDLLSDASEAESEGKHSIEGDVAPQTFRPFSLSSSLESLLNGYFVQILQLRIQHDLGWAGAEFLCWEIETSQNPPEQILRRKAEEIRRIDREDATLSESYRLPADCLLERHCHDAVNLPLVVFSYLLRRLMLCPRYCLVCHQQLKEDLDALKPYVCNSPLCTYQYYNLNRGPSLEYEIRSNPAVVDLLVSLAYVAAAEGSLDAPLPIGMGLQVKCRTPQAHMHGPDRLCDFDNLDLPNMRLAIRDLIDMLPPILELKRHLERPRTPGRAKPRLRDIDPTIPRAAWLVLRWCELQSNEEKVMNMGTSTCRCTFAVNNPTGVDPIWRQFRFSVGAPDAEAKFRKAVQLAKTENSRAHEFPSLYVWNIVHLLQAYSVAASASWKNSSVMPSACVALAEIVNLPSKFVSSSPYLVVDQTEWIVCRYLMVRSSMAGSGVRSTVPASLSMPMPNQPHGQPVDQSEEGTHMDEEIPYVPLDPLHPLTLSQALIRIPEPGYAIEKLLTARRDEFLPVKYDEEDLQIFEGRSGSKESQQGIADRSAMQNDWKHDREWVNECIEHLMPPPTESSIMASTTLQKELRAMLKEQNAATSLRELGWYMPEEFMGDNLYQWIVELHSFDESLPIAKDLAKNNINSLVFEIRFPSTFPHSPPFMRILKPRFLPFIHVGGIGRRGSCHRRYTSPAHRLLDIAEIRVSTQAARLVTSVIHISPLIRALRYGRPYGMYEALEGYKRAASTHGWKVGDLETGLLEPASR